MGIHILNFLDDRLILVLSEDELLSHRFVLLSQLECPGLRVNFAKSALSLGQRISFLGTFINWALMRAAVMPEHALAIQQLEASFKLGVPRKAFQRMRFSVFGTSVGPASHAAPSVLAETSSSSTCLASRKPPCQGEPGLRCSSGKPAFSLWSKKECYLHINCLEMLAVCLGLRTFLPDLKGTSRLSPLG